MSPFRKIQPPGAKLKMGSLFVVAPASVGGQCWVQTSILRRSCFYRSTVGSLVPFLWFAWLLASLLSFFASLRQRTQRPQASRQVSTFFKNIFSRTQVCPRLTFSTHNSGLTPFFNSSHQQNPNPYIEPHSTK